MIWSSLSTSDIPVNIARDTKSSVWLFRGSYYRESELFDLAFPMTLAQGHDGLPLYYHYMVLYENVQDVDGCRAL